MRTSIFSVTLASLCLLSLASGCLYEIRDEIVDCEISIRNHHRAWDAWNRCLPVYSSIDHCRDFEHGFIEGYKATAMGGNGCPPALPPARYWKAEYQSEEGKAKTHAWFDGFSHGALAADADGVAELNRIVNRGGRPSDGHQVAPPALDPGMPIEMTPADAPEAHSFPPAPADSGFSGPAGRSIQTTWKPHRPAPADSGFSGPAGRGAVTMAPGL